MLKATPSHIPPNKLKSKNRMNKSKTQRKKKADLVKPKIYKNYIYNWFSRL